MMTDKDLKTMHNQFKYLEKSIKEYDVILILRHKNPDYDALGSQCGLAQLIKDNYPNKKVFCLGNDQAFMPDLFPYPDDLKADSDLLKNNKYLVITTDISNRSRLDGNEYLQGASEIIKIDHHNSPSNDEQFGDYFIVYPSRPAASEIIALFALSRDKKFILSKQASSYLYTGIIGDTGRFLFPETDGATLRIAADLVDTGINKDEIYSKIYETDLRRMNILRFCLDTYKVTDKGTLYMVFKKEDLERLNMDDSEAKLHINTFRDMKGIKSIITVCYDAKNLEYPYKVSLRSAKYNVCKVAEKYHGGGHDFASGAKLHSLDELPALLTDLDNITL